MFIQSIKDRNIIGQTSKQIKQSLKGYVERNQCIQTFSIQICIAFRIQHIIQHSYAAGAASHNAPSENEAIALIN